MKALSLSLTEILSDEKFVREVLIKYHYPEEDYEGLLSAAREMIPLVREEFRCGYRLFDVQGIKYAEAGMTLGEAVDELQYKYASAEEIAKCFMLEALSGELLMRAYTLFNAQIAEETEYHVARYYFPGSDEEHPLEMIPGILEALKLPIRCNEALCMLPKKSVAFLAELTTDPSVHCRGICMGCGRRNCPNRWSEENIGRRLARMTDMPQTYGFSRIFGV